MIERAIDEVKATRLVVALDDTDGLSWRKLEYPEYKAHRTVQTAPWLLHGADAMAARGWCVEVAKGYEAEDIIATVAMRSLSGDAWGDVAALSSDSDLIPLIDLGVRIVKPAPAGAGFQHVSADEVRRKYSVSSPSRLVDFKAMVGESSDNIAGVPGIGPKRAAGLLAKFGTLEGIIAAGERGDDKHAAVVCRHANAARVAFRLITLPLDVPVRRIAPGECAVG